jgi:hypothetical protein
MGLGLKVDRAPISSDLASWRQAIADDCLKVFRLEAIAAAFQDLGQRDHEVRHSLAKHLSESILRILRNHVGFNHPNRGEDIILRVHGEIFLALLRPTSADGRNLRIAFVPRLLFRIKDAIASEERERRIPDGTKPKKKSKRRRVKDSRHAEGVELVVSAENTESAEKPEAAEDGDIVAQKTCHMPMLDAVREADQQIDVDRILERVPDPRKRLAFYLFMNDLPYKSKRKDVNSIARALDISDKTAREWVEEVRQFLAYDEDVKYLRNGE